MADSWAILNALAAAVGAVGTVSAVAVALGIAIRDRRMIRAERNDELAAQARGVVSSVPAPSLVTISNHSREPVLAVRVTGVTAVLRHPGAPPERYEGGVDPDLNGVIAPGDTWETAMWLVSSKSQHLLEPGNGDNWHVSVVFQLLDADGLWWERTDNGSPRRILA